MRPGQPDGDPFPPEAAAKFEPATEGPIRRRKVLRPIPKAKEGQPRTLIQTMPETARSGLSDLCPQLVEEEQQPARLCLVAYSGLAAGLEVLSVMGAAVLTLVSAALIANPAPLITLAHLSCDTPPEQAASARADASWLANVLSCLGLLLTAGDSANVIQTVTGAGMYPADPILDRLNFTATLKGS